jgi:NAD(P)H-dependent flavin oxidoreductase YrpB (nitropropane dioxygenase family)
MIRTRITQLFGIDCPIVSAGMAGVAFADLAVAVSEAGGLGVIGAAGLAADRLDAELRAARALTRKPLAVNFIVPFLSDDALDAALGARADAVWFFWADPDRALVERCHRAGARVLWQCGSTAEARAARDAGVDVVIAQGYEAGGHVRGTVTTVALVPGMRDALGDLPLLAAGGLADGRGLAAALALGADGAVFGTRFLASEECAAHAEYKRRIVAASSDDTIHTLLFDVGWPDAPHRVLRTSLVREWEMAGRPPSGARPHEGEPTGRLLIEGAGAPLVSYSAHPPANYFDGNIDGHANYAGQGVGLVREILPAGEILRRIVREAEQVIAGRLSGLVS